MAGRDIEFVRADRAIAKTAKTITDCVTKLLDSHGGSMVSGQYLLEGLLDTLLSEHDGVAAFDKWMLHLGPTTIKLSNALADWRDSPRDR